MSPRKYEMTKRAASAEATRRRIVDAARALHGEQGIEGTSWEDIAARAQVSVGTVYRHFPSLDELVPACGKISMASVALPDPARLADLFTGLETAEARLQKLVSEVLSIWERGANDLRPVWREPQVHRSVAQVKATVDSLLAEFVRVALAPLRVGAAERRLVRAMIDLATWEALRAQGLGEAEIRAGVSRMLTSTLDARSTTR